MTEELDKALAEYSRRLRELFENDLIGVYLTGSLALGTYHEGKSDVDCTVLLQSPPSNQRIEGLKKLHEVLRRSYKKTRIESHYITCNDLGKDPEDIDPLVSYHDGRLSKSKFNINPVTWVTLKRHGVTVAGPDVGGLVFDIPSTALTTYVVANVDTYWKKWLSRSKQLYRPLGLYALTDSAIEWSVSGISRMLFTLDEADIASKEAALEYMLAKVPERYHRILHEALRIRTGSKDKRYSSPLTRRSDMLSYLEYVIDRIHNSRGGDGASA